MVEKVWRERERERERERNYRNVQHWRKTIQLRRERETKEGDEERERE